MINRLILSIFLLSGASYGSSPTELAVRFLEVIRDDKPRNEIVEACLLNSETGDLKKAMIYDLWLSYGKTMLDASFSVVEEKIENDHAAVVLWQRMGKNHQSFQIHAVALVLDQGVWKPAPVLSSFENSIATFSRPILETRKNLVRWMNARVEKAQQELAWQIKQEFELEMRNFITPEKLETADTATMLQSFIQAVRDRNPAAAIAHLGGYTKNPSAELIRIHKQITSCFEKSETMTAWPWKLLTDPRTILIYPDAKEQNGTTTLQVLALHQESLYAQPQILEFKSSKDENKIGFLELPKAFISLKASEDDDSVLLDSSTSLMKALKNYIKEKRNLETSKTFESAEDYAKHLCLCLAENDFARFWTSALPENIPNKGRDIPEITNSWQSLQQATGTSINAFITHKQEGDYATAVLQSFSAREGIEIKYLHLKLADKRWHLIGDEPDELPENINKWIQQNSDAWEKSPTIELTNQSQRISGLANTQLKADDISKVFGSLQTALMASNLRSALPFCAAFDDETSRNRMLKNLGGSLTHDLGTRTALKVHVSGRWGAVSTRLELKKLGAKPQFPLDVFVATDAGPRLLPQIDLRISPGNNSRDFLNKNTMRDLGKIVPEQALQELQEILNEHTKLVANQPLIPATK